MGRTWTLLAGAMLTTAVAVVGAQGSFAGLGCRENVNHPMWNYITQIAPRRHLVVDEERGLVSDMYMFRHGGTEPTYTLPSGEVVKHSEAMGCGSRRS